MIRSAKARAAILTIQMASHISIVFLALFANLYVALAEFKYFDNITSDNLTLQKNNIHIPAIGNIFVLYFIYSTNRDHIYITLIHAHFLLNQIANNR